MQSWSTRIKTTIIKWKHKWSIIHLFTLYIASELTQQDCREKYILEWPVWQVLFYNLHMYSLIFQVFFFLENTLSEAGNVQSKIFKKDIT